MLTITVYPTRLEYFKLADHTRHEMFSETCFTLVKNILIIVLTDAALLCLIILWHVPKSSRCFWGVSTIIVFGLVWIGFFQREKRQTKRNSYEPLENTNRAHCAEFSLPFLVESSCKGYRKDMTCYTCSRMLNTRVYTPMENLSKSRELKMASSNTCTRILE